MFAGFGFGGWCHPVLRGTSDNKGMVVNVPDAIGGFGAFNRKPRKIAGTTSERLGADDILAEMSGNTKLHIWRYRSSLSDVNVPDVIGGFGAFNKNPRKIAGTTSEWLGADDILAEMSGNAKLHIWRCRSSCLAWGTPRTTASTTVGGLALVAMQSTAPIH
eukprot:jgi/Undpi1/13243/HiC_scaffold_8.g02905.m1